MPAGAGLTTGEGEAGGRPERQGRNRRRKSVWGGTRTAPSPSGMPSPPPVCDAAPSPAETFFFGDACHRQPNDAQQDAGTCQRGGAAGAGQALMPAADVPGARCPAETWKACWRPSLSFWRKAPTRKYPACEAKLCMQGFCAVHPARGKRAKQPSRLKLFRILFLNRRSRLAPRHVIH